MVLKKEKPKKKFKVEEIEEESPTEEVKPTTEIITDQTQTEDTVSTEKTTQQTSTSPDKTTQNLTSFKLADIEKKEDSDILPEDLQEKATQSVQSESQIPEVKTDLPQEIDKEENQDWLKDVNVEGEGPEKGKSKKKKMFFILFILIIVAGVISGGIWYFNNNFKKEDSDTNVDNGSQVVTPSPEVSATPTQAQEVDTSEYSINILNGSGIAGEAGRVENLLSDIDFKVIDTANADSYDYVETEVQIKENLPDTLYNLIKESLENNYIVTRLDENLTEDSEYDVVIIVGSQKAEPEENTSTESAEE
ncbi:hypothetical protein A2Z22_05360 [Candidatus Woesebacteria bacterium RBG_16_34_12]|uniref:LytR/CpsA/Psr regulator C-terminal domain-containing protein n=1 Tax=Candidatus Woesebacteria bacterium RBG_16_34_12 TaxID=1802480 RepID=A0A1F7X8Q8_9BACT|nr:MAG: hypothetical protein A2Z22_05360 [Candidatus Woesebacteria bacterium RBG_16_34_12]